MPDPEIKPEEATIEVQDKDIEINLDKPAEGTTKPTSSEPKYVTVDDLEKVRKQLNGLSYMGRQFQELSKKLDSLQVQHHPQRVQGDKDEYDELVEKDWKQAVRKLAQEEYLRERQFQLQQEQQRNIENSRLSILDQSRQKVMEKYPEVQDPQSDISKRYMSILNKNQDYLRNERGPILAMRDLEDELREEGRLDEFTKRVVEKEVNRQVRTGATGAPRGSTPGSNGNRVSLTREQQEFCKNNSIKFEDYALMLKKQEASGRQGVEV